MVPVTVAPWRRSLVVAALAIAVTSCAHYGGGDTASPPTPTLTGTRWCIENAGGSAVADASVTELRIEFDGRVSGTTGCNNFTGNATLEGTSLSFSPLATTRRACEPRLMSQESDILHGLNLVRSFAFADDGRVDLLDAGGQTALRLARAYP